MPGYASRDGLLGYGPVDNMFTPSSTQLYPAMVEGVFTDPYYGAGTFVYGKAAAAQELGSLVYADVGGVMTDIPNTANTGYPIFFAKTDMAQNDWGWYQRTGIVIASTANSVAAGTACGVAAAGKAGTLANGKQILNAIVSKASTATITKTGSTTNGSKRLALPGVDGLFVGMAVSGTGIAASSTIASIDTGGNYVVLNNAMTATGVVTITFTFTNYLVLTTGGAFVQGQVA